VKKQKLSRSEQTKEVRRILSKNDVDLSEMQVSCSGSRISFYGTLTKRSGGVFSQEALSNMVAELSKYGRISSELSNWDLNGGVRNTEKNKVEVEAEDTDEEEEIY
jgi:hypothetical protein